MTNKQKLSLHNTKATSIMLQSYKYQLIRKNFLPGKDFWLLECYLVLLVFLDQNIYTPLDADLVLPENKNDIQSN